MTMTENDTLAQCKALLELAAKRGTPIVLIEARAAEDGYKAALGLAIDLSTAGEYPAIVGVPADCLPHLYIALPPAELQKFCVGEPVLIEAIRNEYRPKHPTNCPDDTEQTSDAKTALEVGVFGLHASQTAVELSGNTANRAITDKEASDRSQNKLAAAVRKGGKHTTKGPTSALKGLIDRGRRKVAVFFHVSRPTKVAHTIAAETTRRIVTEGPVAKLLIEEDNLSRATSLARHEARAKAHEAAMYRWSRNLDLGQPIDDADLREVANAHADRQSAAELVRLAISGGLNPGLVHRNHGQMRDRFELAEKLGQLMRGEEIKFTLQDAGTLGVAIQTSWRGFPQTDQDCADSLLVDAALNGLDQTEWQRLLAQVTNSGTSVTVRARRNPENPS
jgi:hypothetical protein